MLDHNEWGNDRVIRACGELTDAQFDHEFVMGVGTLRKTITHTIAAMRIWSDRLGGGEIRQVPDRMRPERSIVGQAR